LYFDAGGGRTVKLDWEGPGVAREAVPERALSHKQRAE
jgi:hypothetical protein